MPRFADEPGCPAFVFDVDGVLVDSNAVHTKTWRMYLERCGIVPPEDLPERMFGLHNRHIVRDLFGAQLSDEEVFRHGAQKEAVYRETMAPVLQQHLVRGVARFLERHKTRPMAVASNAEQANVEFVLESARLRRYFLAVMSGNDVSHPKPHPEIYLRAAELLHRPPEECIVFEDTPTGVDAARAAGARVVGVQTTFRDLPGADLLIQDFLQPELEAWLELQASPAR
jgi:beta-phosphoglucomutase family hydrolase